MTKKDNNNSISDDINNNLKVNKISKKNQPTPHPYFKELKGVGFSDDVLSSLGDVQLDILYRYWILNQKVKTIHIQRKTSYNAVQNIKNKLIKNGIIDKFWRPIIGIKVYEKNGGGSSTLPPLEKFKEWRLHAQHFTITLLGTSKRYFLELNKKTQFKLDDNTIRIYAKKITIFSNTSFYGSNPDECFEKGDVYWNNFFLKLEKNLGIKFVDGIKTQIRQFSCHIAKTNSNLAKKVIKNKLYFKFYDDLGRLRLEIDNSKKLFEEEFVNVDFCQDDANKHLDYSGDIITKQHYLPSEVKSLIDLLSTSQNKTQINIDEMLLMFKAQLKTNEVQSNTNKILINEVQKLKNGEY